MNGPTAEVTHNRKEESHETTECTHYTHRHECVQIYGHECRHSYTYTVYPGHQPNTPVLLLNAYTECLHSWTAPDAHLYCVFAFGRRMLNTHTEHAAHSFIFAAFLYGAVRMIRSWRASEKVENCYAQQHFHHLIIPQNITLYTHKKHTFFMPFSFKFLKLM